MGKGFKDLIKNISMKRKFKDLVKVIEDKDRIVNEKVKYIENILDSTPGLVDVKDSKNGYTLLHYVMDKFNDYFIGDMDDYLEGKYDDEPELTDDYIIVNEPDTFEEFEVENNCLIVSQKDVESEYSKLNLKVDDMFFRLVDLLLKKGADLSEEDRYGRSPLNIIKTNSFSSSFYSNLSNKADGAFQRILERIRNPNSQNLDNTETQVVNLDSSGPSSCMNKVVPPCNQVKMGRKY